MARSYVYRGINGTIQADINKNDAFVNIARITTMTIRVNRDLKRFFQVGRQSATEILEGNIEIGGRIAKAIWDGRLLKFVIGIPSKDKQELITATRISTITNPTPFQVPLKIRTFLTKDTLQSGNKPLEIELHGVKIQQWNFNLAFNDFITEQFEYWATDIVDITEDADQFWTSPPP